MRNESRKLLRKLTKARGLAVLRVPMIAASLSLAVAQAQAPVDIRVALIIGNGAYSHVTALANPANDARAMAATLRQLGFSVIELRDGDKAQMTEAIVKVRQSLAGKQGIGMLYYAGHGLQLDWHNYMVPVDANPASSSDVPAQTIDVSSVIDTFKGAGNRMNILVLDACRDNPFSDTTRDITSGKGLAQLDAPPGTILAFATAPGNVAEDGDEKSGNGLYTQFLLQELRKPTAKIEDVFKRVRLNVRKQSQGRQIPWESTSLEDDFYFNDGVKFTIQPEELKRLADEAREKELALQRQAALVREREQQIAQALAQEKLRMAEAQKLNEAEARRKAQELSLERERQLVLEQMQEKERATAATQALAEARRTEDARLNALEVARVQGEQARAREKLSKEAARQSAFSEESAAWEKIKDSRSANDFYAYLQAYPNGLMSEQAQFSLDRLEKARIQIQQDRNGIQALASGTNRFAKGDEWIVELTNGFNNAKRTIVQRVTEADGDKVVINGGDVVYNQMGGIIKNQFGVKSPPLLGAPADLALGKRWRTAFNNTRSDGVKESNYWDYKVVALEEVQAMGRTIKAFKVEGSGFATYPGGVTALSSTGWIDPSTMLLVRGERLFRANGRIIEFGSAVMIEYRPAARCETLSTRNLTVTHNVKGCS